MLTKALAATAAQLRALAIESFFRDMLMKRNDPHMNLSPSHPETELLAAWPHAQIVLICSQHRPLCVAQDTFGSFMIKSLPINAKAEGRHGQRSQKAKQWILRTIAN